MKSTEPNFGALQSIALFAVTFIVGVAVILTFLNPDGPEPKDPQQLEDTRCKRKEAFPYSLQFVRQRLSPNSTNFDRQNYTVRPTDGACIYRVQGRVDTKNAFGGSVWRYYSITMEYRNGTWYGSDLSIK